jgi:hypothetical protein
MGVRVTLVLPKDDMFRSEDGVPDERYTDVVRWVGMLTFNKLKRVMLL